MAIKVVRHGNSIFPLQVTCHNQCGALIEVGGVRDIRVIRKDSEIRVPTIECPDCGSIISLYESDREQALFEYDNVREMR